MAFKFRLQKILDIKEKEEDEKKNSAAIANNEVVKAKIQLEQLQDEYRQKGIERTEKNEQGCQLSEIMDINAYINHLYKRIEDKKQEIIKLEHEAEKRRREYIETKKSRKTYDNLKDRKYQRFLEEEQKQEAKIIDQIVSYSYTRKKNKQKATYVKE